jgi:hypothetical protein
MTDTMLSSARLYGEKVRDEWGTPYRNWRRQ